MRVSSAPSRGTGETLTSSEPGAKKLFAKPQGLTPGLGTRLLKRRPHQAPHSSSQAYAKRSSLTGLRTVPRSWGPATADLSKEAWRTRGGHRIRERGQRATAGQLEAQEEDNTQTQGSWGPARDCG